MADNRTDDERRFPYMSGTTEPAALRGILLPTGDRLFYATRLHNRQLQFSPVLLRGRSLLAFSDSENSGAYLPHGAQEHPVKLRIHEISGHLVFVNVQRSIPHRNRLALVVAQFHGCLKYTFPNSLVSRLFHSIQGGIIGRED